MNILLGVSGGIAAYKTPTFASILKQNGHEVIVCVTNSALDFVTEMSLATMSGNPVISNLSNEIGGEVSHIKVAQWCDVFVVVPATANFIAKMAHGIADDALSTIHLALPADKKIKICPAMNTNMYENPIVQSNLVKIDTPFILVPESGKLACGDVGIGKLPGTKRVIEFIEAESILECM